MSAPFHSFWDAVDNSGGLDACWPWLGCRGTRGHGRINRKRWGEATAHRYVYRLAHPNEPMPEAVMHECDNPSCCNPLHLKPGTLVANTHEAHERGLYPRGEGHPKTRLTFAQVKEIRSRHAAGEGYRKLAKAYDVHRVYVGQIVRFQRRIAA